MSIMHITKKNSRFDIFTIKFLEYQNSQISGNLKPLVHNVSIKTIIVRLHSDISIFHVTKPSIFISIFSKSLCMSLICWRGCSNLISHFFGDFQTPYPPILTLFPFFSPILTLFGGFSGWYHIWTAPKSK